MCCYILFYFIRYKFTGTYLPNLVGARTRGAPTMRRVLAALALEQLAETRGAPLLGALVPPSSIAPNAAEPVMVAAQPVVDEPRARRHLPCDRERGLRRTRLVPSFPGGLVTMAAEVVPAPNATADAMSKAHI